MNWTQALREAYQQLKEAELLRGREAVERKAQLGQVKKLSDVNARIQAARTRREQKRVQKAEEVKAMQADFLNRFASRSLKPKTETDK